MWAIPTRLDVPWSVYACVCCVTTMSSAKKQLNQSRCHLSVADSCGPRKLSIRCGCTLAPPGKYDGPICAAQVMQDVTTITVATWFTWTQCYGPQDLMDIQTWDVSGETTKHRACRPTMLNATNTDVTVRRGEPRTSSLRLYDVQQNNLTTGAKYHFSHLVCANNKICHNLELHCISQSAAIANKLLCSALACM